MAFMMKTGFQSRVCICQKDTMLTNRLLVKLPIKGWMKCSINRLLQKLRETGTGDRCVSSGSAQTKEKASRTISKTASSHGLHRDWKRPHRCLAMYSRRRPAATTYIGLT